MNMDVDTLRSIMTVLSFITFVAIVAWAWSGRSRARFERAAQLPFEEDRTEQSQ
jgi:cytochrome c oxidase cbb3-type subunit IV